MSLAELYAIRQDEMNAVYDGAVLRERADRLLKLLPPGPVVLVSTSEQGAGIAAAAAALRTDETSWRRVDPLLPVGLSETATVVIVEPIQGNSAWRQAVERRWPAARVMVLGATGRAQTTLAA
jgi:hypothetical protein